MPTTEISLKANPSLANPFPRNDRLSLGRICSTYQRIAPVYDQLFGACFRPGQHAAVSSLHSQPGDKILEIGVGTGLALPLWHRQSAITGIDLSQKMIKRASRICHQFQLDNVDLHLMDAQATSYPDNHFDKIAAMYVVSVVPNVPALLAEMQRICKPGGRIAIINHFAHRNPLVYQMERVLENFAPLLGFHTTLPLENVTCTPGLKILQIERVNWFGYWTLILAENHK